jgi:hypothetical protein
VVTCSGSRSGDLLGVGSLAGGEDGSWFGSLAVDQWWGLSNEAFDVRRHVVGVGALCGKHVVRWVGCAGRR